MSKSLRQPGTGVHVARPGVEPIGHPTSPAVRALPRGPVLEPASARRGHRPVYSLLRAATALPAGPDATDLVARVRGYLADDLDTPAKVIAALDGRATHALEYGGHDPEAPRLVATAIDALLGVDL